MEETQLPKGAPVNLLELLENCHELVPCLENSSCASSDCGDGNGESPLKRRKRRKNRTGWPGNKLRRKLHNRQLSVYETDKKLETNSELPSVKEDVCERLDVSLCQNERDVKTSENNHISKTSESCTENSESKSSRLTDSPDRRSQHSEDLKSEKSSKEKSESEDTSKQSQSSEDKSGKSSKDTESSDTEESSKTNSESSEDSETPSNDKETSETDDSKKELKSGKETSEDDETSSKESSSNSKVDVEKEEISKRDSSKSKKDSSSDTVKNTTNSDTSQLSESSSGNDENLKIGNKRHDHSATSSDRESLAKRLMKNNVSPKKRNITKSIIRNRNGQRTSGSSETRVINFKTKCVSRRRPMQSSSRSGGIRSSSSTSIIIDDENCKQNTFVNISSRTRLRRVRGGLTSENGDVDCPLSERVNSPVATPTDLQNRRSSIEFQPVVRVMKIEDQVDRDHSILSVAVASNRRLRSSGTSKSSQPPKKRFKSSGRGHFSRWLKSS